MILQQVGRRKKSEAHLGQQVSGPFRVSLLNRGVELLVDGLDCGYVEVVWTLLAGPYVVDEVGRILQGLPFVEECPVCGSIVSRVVSISSRSLRITT